MILTRKRKVEFRIITLNKKHYKSNFSCQFCWKYITIIVSISQLFIFSLIFIKFKEQKRNQCVFCLWKYFYVFSRANKHYWPPHSFQFQSLCLTNILAKWFKICHMLYLSTYKNPKVAFPIGKDNIAQIELAIFYFFLHSMYNI